jgi:hypothetical protein
LAEEILVEFHDRIIENRVLFIRGKRNIDRTKFKTQNGLIIDDDGHITGCGIVNGIAKSHDPYLPAFIYINSHFQEKEQVRPLLLLEGKFLQGPK